jgi:hypothetical protein
LVVLSVGVVVTMRSEYPQEQMLQQIDGRWRLVLESSDSSGFDVYRLAATPAADSDAGTADPQA